MISLKMKKKCIVSAIILVILLVTQLFSSFSLADVNSTTDFKYIKLPQPDSLAMPAEAKDATITDNYTLPPAADASVVNANSPVIGEGNQNVRPNESFTLTGTQFSSYTDVNIALGKTAYSTDSSGKVTDLPILTDGKTDGTSGDKTTGWTTTAQGQSFVIDLQQEYDITKTVLQLASDQIGSEAYKIEGSSDGINYTQVLVDRSQKLRTVSNNKEFDDAYGVPIKARYLRYTYANSLKETGVTLDDTSASIGLIKGSNNTIQLNATVWPSDASDKTVTWTSSDTSIATVDASGTVTAVADGTAQISATTTDGTNIKSSLCAVTVSDSTDAVSSVQAGQPDKDIQAALETEATANFTITEFEVYIKNVKLGSDTTVWIWSGLNGGTLREADLSTVEQDTIVGTIPSDMPLDMYLLYVENDKGISKPFVLNRTNAEWVGPLGNTFEPGSTERVFGENLTKGFANSDSDVYIQSDSGGKFINMPLSTNPSDDINTYAVSFVVPPDTALGNYKLYVHNGYGGQYGWSQPVDIVIANKFQFGPDVIAVNPSGGDDSATIAAAMATLSKKPNGGTIRLGVGTYVLNSDLYVTSNIRIVGVDMNQTILLLNNGSILLSDGANNITFADLAFKMGPSDSTVKAGDRKSLDIHTQNYSDTSAPKNNNVLIDSVKMMEVDTPQQYFSMDLRVQNSEIRNSIFYDQLQGSGSGLWIHNNQLEGTKGSDWVCDGTTDWKGEGTNGDDGTMVFEYNTAETPIWPYDPTTESVNYKNFEPETGLDSSSMRQGNSRLVYFSESTESLKYSYVAHNTTKDTAVDSNKGEQILFHTSESDVALQAQTSDANVITINTNPDSTLSATRQDGTTVSVTGAVPDRVGLQKAALSVPMSIDNTAAVVVMSGTGMGEYAFVKSHTANTITLDTPFNVPLDNTSVFIITFIYYGMTTYDNNLSGVPQGWVDDSSMASMGNNFDGGAFNCVCDSDTVTRSYYSETIQGYGVGPSMWDELRNSKTITPYRDGDTLNARVNTYTPGLTEHNLLGPVLIGAWIRGANSDSGLMVMSEAGGIGNINNATAPFIIGSGFENSTVNLKEANGDALSKNASVNYGLPQNGAVVIEDFANVLVRNITISDNIKSVLGAITPPKVASSTYSNAIFSNITANGKNVVYSGTGSNPANPVASQRALYFFSPVGGDPSRQQVDLSYYGANYADWTVDKVEVDKTDPLWLETAVQNNILDNTEPTGNLVVGVNTAGLKEGIHDGTVYIKSLVTNEILTVGVKLDINNSYQVSLVDSSAKYQDILRPIPGLVSVTTSQNQGAVSQSQGTASQSQGTASSPPSVSNTTSQNTSSSVSSSPTTTVKTIYKTETTTKTKYDSTEANNKNNILIIILIIASILLLAGIIAFILLNILKKDKGEICD